MCIRFNLHSFWMVGVVGILSRAQDRPRRTAGFSVGDGWL